jgi:hypothetical protein
MASAATTTRSASRSNVGELGGGEAHLAGKRLAMDEARVERRLHELVAMLRRHLDEIAQHVVVPDF